MEKLEKALEKVNSKETKKEICYKGLVLIENRTYQGGTSIKYWM